MLDLSQFSIEDQNKINQLSFLDVSQKKIKDKTGNQSGFLTVLGLAEIKNQRYYWYAICSCGEIIKIRSDAIGTTQSCYKCSRKRAGFSNQKPRINLTGNKYGKLTVTGISNKRTKSGIALWECKCDCGNITYVSSNNLKSGHIKSCGCLRVETTKNIGEHNKKDLTNKRFNRLLVLEEAPEK